MIKKEKKQQVISEHRHNNSDVGSTEVQIALLTESINQLNQHFAKFPKDLTSRTGLMKMVGRRRKLLKYLEGEDKKSYLSIIEKLKLRD
jgi:small subunit ribosomal protein S15